MKLNLLFFLVFSLICKELIVAQLPIDSDAKTVVYTEVVELPGMSKSEIYNKAKMWVVSTLKSGDNMIELSGTTSDQIVAAGNILTDSVHRERMDVMPTYIPNSYLNFKFIVHVKEGRLKYSIENFLLVAGRTGNTSLYQMGDNLFSRPNHLKRFKEENTMYLDRKVRAVISNFKNYMNRKVEDDW